MKQEPVEPKDIPANTKESVPCVSVGGIVSVLMIAKDHVIVEWKSSAFSDMIADSIVALILSIETNPHHLKSTVNHICIL